MKHFKEIHLLCQKKQQPSKNSTQFWCHLASTVQKTGSPKLLPIFGFLHFSRSISY